MTEPELSSGTRRKLDALGAEGEIWRASLPEVLDVLAASWGVTIGSPLHGGSSGYVAEATRDDGARGVVKVSMPDGLEGNSEFGRELAALRSGQGRGYVDLWEVDESRRAVLMERLGGSLAASGLAAEAQLDAVAATLAPTWTPVDPPALGRTGAEQAAFLDAFVASRWESTGRPCSAAVTDVARALAQTCRARVERGVLVAVHGDAHPANVLEDPAAPGSYKLVDPDPMASEPAHDLGVLLREWNAELRSAVDSRAVLAGWCRRVARPHRVDPRAVWEWAFVERVSTGLFLVELGEPSGIEFLDVAERLVGPELRRST